MSTPLLFDRYGRKGYIFLAYGLLISLHEVLDKEKAFLISFSFSLAFASSKTLPVCRKNSFRFICLIVILQILGQELDMVTGKVTETMMNHRWVDIQGRR